MIGILRGAASLVELIDISFNLGDVLEAYEQSNIKFENTGYKFSEKNLRQIKIDIPRAMGFLKNDEKKDFYLEMLRKILNSIEFEYIQGLDRITEVILYYYTSDEVNKLFNSKNVGKNVENNEAMNTTSAINCNKEIKISDVLTEELKKKIVKILTEIFYSKFLPFFENFEKKPLKPHKIFKVIEKKYKNNDFYKIISPSDQISYLSSFYFRAKFLFYLGEFEKIEDKYFILSIALATPKNVLDVIFFFFFDSIINGKPINIDQKNFLKDIIKVESDFLKYIIEVELDLLKDNIENESNFIKAQ